MRTEKFESLESSKTWRNGIKHLRKSDRRIASIIDRFGAISRDWSPDDPYEAMVESFVFQQISGSAAESILKKFKKLYGGRLPKPKQFLKTPESRVRGAGISPQKYTYIRNLCERIVDGDLDLESLHRLPDEEVIAVLDDLKGVGRWTAEMFLMFNLKRIDVFPFDDLGIRKAVMKVYGLGHMPNREKMEALSEKWRPYRSMAALYLWKSQDSAPLAKTDSSTTAKPK